MIDLVRASWILFTRYAREALVAKRTLMALLLAAIPVVAAFLVRHFADRIGPPPVLEVGWTFVMLVVVPLVSLILATAVVSEEVEDRTITYLLVRPIPRMAILLSRWLAVLPILLALLGASMGAVILLVSDAAGSDPEAALAPDARTRLFFTALIGGAVYSAVFAAAGTFLRRPVLVGLCYAFAVEGFLANLPGKNQTLTIQYYLKCFLAGGDPEILARLEQSFLQTAAIPPQEALFTLAGVLVAALALGSWAVSRRQFLLPS